MSWLETEKQTQQIINDDTHDISVMILQQNYATLYTLLVTSINISQKHLHFKSSHLRVDDVPWIRITLK